MPTTTDAAGATPTSRLARGSLALAIARRYLRSARKDAFVSFLAAAAAGGIALGVTALILALAALGGFQGALRDEILARTPQLSVRPPAGHDPIALAGEIAAHDAVEGAQAVLRGRGWLVRGGSARPVELIAYDGDLPMLFPRADSRRPGLYVGSSLAEVWRIEPGDVVELVSARPTLTPFGPQPRVRRLAVTGLFETGRTEYADRVALPWAEGVSLVGLGGAEVVVAVGGLEQADAALAALAPLLPAGSGTSTWRELNRALLFALRLEKSLMFLGIFLIVVVAALALVSSLMLILASKRSEVGMLRAMGADRAAVRRIFLWLAGLLAGGGALAGLAAGVPLAWALDRWRLLALPEQVYFLDYVPFRLAAGDLATVLIAAVVLAGGCSWWAAGRAADLEPVEALRR